MHEIETLKNFLSFPISSTVDIFNEFRKLENNIFREADTTGKQRFLYIEGSRENKVLLVAHADTFYDEYYSYPPQHHTLVCDSEVITAKDENGNPQLLGADDRAGIAMLWLLKDSGHSLLITDGEEDKQIGSKWLMNSNTDIATRINENHQFMLQLDRRNAHDYKCYHVGTDKFRKFIHEKTSYKDAGKSACTDICTLCQNVCGVNLSVGYYEEHGTFESLHIQKWLSTFNTVKNLISDNLPKFLLLVEENSTMCFY